MAATRIITRIALVIFVGSIFAVPALAQMNEPVPGRPVNQQTDVGIDQKLNAQVPLDATFRDENDKPVRLGDLIGKKPAVLNMIFYRCTGTCQLEADGMLQAFKALRFNIGDEFNVVTVSINPTEGPSLAQDKQEAFLNAYRRKVSPEGWKFLVGDREQINRLATAVGFRYVYDAKKDQIAHATGIMVLTPEGRVSRYFPGVNYSATELRLSLVEASAGKIGNVVDSVVLYCSQFNPLTGKRSLMIMNLLKLAGIATALCLAISISVMSVKHRRVAIGRLPRLDPPNSGNGTPENA